MSEEKFYDSIDYEKGYTRPETNKQITFNLHSEWLRVGIENENNLALCLHPSNDFFFAFWIFFFCDIERFKDKNNVTSYVSYILG